MTHVRRPFVIAFVTTVATVFGVFVGSAFGVFGHCCPRINANETAAIATLRNIRSAQGQFREHCADHYGTFGELSGATPIRGTDHPLDPPVLSGAFKVVQSDRTVLRSGYRFRFDFTEGGWCAYAWPHERSRSNHRSFFIDGSTETVLATANEAHEGDRGPTGTPGPDWIEVH